MGENKYYTLLDDDNRIVMVTVVQQEPEQFLFEYPDGFNFGEIHDYKILDGELIHDTIPIPEPPEPQPSQEEQISEIQLAICDIYEMLTLGNIL